MNGDGEVGQSTGVKKRNRTATARKCYSFIRGNCQFGDSCKFRHVLENDSTDLPIKKHSVAKSPPEVVPIVLVENNSKPKVVPLAKNNNNNNSRNNTRNNVNANMGELKVNEAIVDDTIASHLTNETFSSLPISEHLIRAIEEQMGYTNLTEVQSKSLPGILSGMDCLARAKTGTGKTLAFLIPAIERLLRITDQNQGRKSSKTISTLVLSPTRELANQIGKEATKLLHYLPNHRVVTLTGGTNRNSDVRHLNETITILVATPGRLVDHLDNTEGIVERLQQIFTLVLDEADVLLEMGFKLALDRIMGYLGHNDFRQTLLFSATISPQVQQIASNVLKSDFSKIDTIGDQTINHTHEHVQQDVIITTMENLIPSLLLILMEQILIPDYKIIVFFTTARLTGYMATIFRYIPEFANLLEIHSRKSQSYRTNSSEQFRKLHHSILFSSDVSARGMDYPNVTFVLQVGLTEKEQYIHRLGRTARAGKSGSGTLLLYDFEETYMLQKTLKDLSIQRRDIPASNLIEANHHIQHIIDTTKEINEVKISGEQAYQAWLGFYNSNLRACNWNKNTLVEMANRFSQIIGFNEPPALEAKTIGKMGLKGVNGLRIEKRRV